MNEHIPVLLNEALNGLNLKPDGIYIDATLGRGGHSRAILEHKVGHLVALDKDLAAITAATWATHYPNCTIMHESFASMAQVAGNLNLIGKVNGILLDLGVSSPQLQSAERGFSFRLTGPLDMRMNQSLGQTVGQWLQFAPIEEITMVLKVYGEERFAYRIAKAIVAYRAENELNDTKTLADIISRVVPIQEASKHKATRSFQAFRIFINNELDELRLGLKAALEILAPGGRLVVISFHSLEDRIVKQLFQQEAGKINNNKLPLPVTNSATIKLIAKIKPSTDEINRNIRSRSAIMRIAERI